MTKPSPYDHELLARCIRIIRGEAPGRQPCTVGSLPDWGQASLEGQALIWSGPFNFDLDVKYGLAIEVLPGVYIMDTEKPAWMHLETPKPSICFIIGESATWATLWPNATCPSIWPSATCPSM